MYLVYLQTEISILYETVKLALGALRRVSEVLRWIQQYKTGYRLINTGFAKSS